MADSRPNILWYCTDQQRFDTIAALGNEHVHTDTVDGLVERGVSFTRTYCQSPICTPSRASFLTGQLPSTVRANGNGIEFMPQDYPLVTQLLADAGYDCGLVGKLHIATAEAGVEPRGRDGYRFFAYSHAPRDDWPEGHAYVEWLEERGQDLKSLLASPDNVPAEYQQTTWATDACIEFIDQPRNGPWLLSVNPYYPHPPFNPPREYFERFDPESLPGPIFEDGDLAIQRRISDAGIDFQNYPEHPDSFDGRRIQAQYYAMIELIDDQLARLLKHIEAAGQLDDTLIIFTSDHGESLGDHGLVEKGCRFMEGMARVPLVMSWPGHFSQGLRSDALVQLTDIAPTLLEVAGLDIPERMNGRSLLPILTGDADPDNFRDYVRCEFRNAIRLGDGTHASMIADKRWKLVLYHGKDGLGELYDLVADPNEHRNLYYEPESAEVINRYMIKMFDDTVFETDWGPRRVGWI
jgi:arylsulfatase A-like enzyme